MSRCGDAAGRARSRTRSRLSAAPPVQIYDLLDPTSASNGLQLHEDRVRGVFVGGLVEREVTCPREAHEVLLAGARMRRVAGTSMNRESSRSHAVFTLSIESREQQGTVCNVRTSRLHLVDLAGSERQPDTLATGERLKEAGNINRSLSALSNVIMSLVESGGGRARHVPYRNSKLTFLLRVRACGRALHRSGAA